MDAARPLRHLLDRLAGDAARWAPLAAGGAVAELVSGPAERLAGLAPDPLAALQRAPLATPAAAAESAPANRSTRPAARPAAVPVATARGRFASASPTEPAAFPAFPACSAFSTLPDLPLMAPPWRPAAAGARLLPMSSLPAEPVRSVPNELMRMAGSDMALPAGALAALQQRLAAAPTPVPLDRGRLRALAGGSAADPAAARKGGAATPAATPAPERFAADTRPPARPDGRRGEAGAAAPAPAPRPDRAPDPAPDAALAPRTRHSALAELLRRWPGSAGAGPATSADAGAADGAALDQAAHAGVLPPSGLARLASLTGTRPSSAGREDPASGAAISLSDLAPPGAPERALPSDLPLRRSLERVLVAEVRRHGIDLETE